MRKYLAVREHDSLRMLCDGMIAGSVIRTLGCECGGGFGWVWEWGRLGMDLSKGGSFWAEIPVADLGCFY